MNPEQQILMNMFELESKAWQHQEIQRATVTNLFVFVSAALIGLVTYDGKITTTDLVPAILITCLGLFGLAFSAKFYERYNRHLWRARRYRSELDQLTPNISLDEWISEVHEEVRKVSYVSRKLHKYRLHWFWFALYAFISLIGIILAIMIAVGS